VIKTIIIEDDDLIRDSLKLIINGSHGLTCIGSFSDAESAIAEIKNNMPDVAIVDIHLPGMTGIEFITRVKPEYSKVQFIIFTVFEDTEHIFTALQAGATGYLLKSTPPVKILEAIQEVQAGSSPMSGSVARKVIESFSSGNKPKTAEWGLLSIREQEILLLLSKGYRYKEIAEELFISIDTVRSHIRHIYEKLQAKSRTDALNKVFLND
jgi:DNA-binding NarL/FixJ family response regulator